MTKRRKLLSLVPLLNVLVGEVLPEAVVEELPPLPHDEALLAHVLEGAGEVVVETVPKRKLGKE